MGKYIMIFSTEKKISLSIFTLSFVKYNRKGQLSNIDKTLQRIISKI